VRWPTSWLATCTTSSKARACSGLLQALDWKLVVLVDEAHNLVERARRLYSAELRISQLRAAAQAQTGHCGQRPRCAASGVRAVDGAAGLDCSQTRSMPDPQEVRHRFERALEQR
jgi:Rad3-related DNA helicase